MKKCHLFNDKWHLLEKNLYLIPTNLQTGRGRC